MTNVEVYKENILWKLCLKKQIKLEIFITKKLTSFGSNRTYYLLNGEGLIFCGNVNKALKIIKEMEKGINGCLPPRKMV